MAAELSRSRKVVEKAAILRAECQRLGRALPPGDGAERLVADRVQMVAQQLGVTPRTVLDRYLTDETLMNLAQTLVGQMDGLAEVMQETAPVEVDRGQGFLVLAAFGMCSTLALHNLDRSEDIDPMIMLRDAADSTVRVAVTLAVADGEAAPIGGMDLAIGRKVLTAVLEQLRTGRWACTCGQPHRADGTCAVQDRMTADLAALGGWGTHGDA